MISDRFVDARKLSRPEAWRQFQVDLMHAASLICPHIIPYKDLISVVADIEKEIKGSTGKVGKSNEELLADFLTGGNAIPVNPEDSETFPSEEEATGLEIASQGEIEGEIEEAS